MSACNVGVLTDAAHVRSELLLRREALATGLSDDELGRLVRAGDLVRLRRGAYVDQVLPRDVAAVHRLLVGATTANLRRSAVLSHQSAAVVHGLPLWDVPLDRVHITRRPPAWNDTSAVLCCHVARLRDDEVVTVGGMEVTTPVRTALDLARSLPHEAAVAMLDAALHQGLLSHDARPRPAPSSPAPGVLFTLLESCRAPEA